MFGVSKENNNTTKPKLLFVGAFPPRIVKVFGGIVTDCRVLMKSTLPSKLDLRLFDSTQISQPPPNFFIRSLVALKRIVAFITQFEKEKPDAVLLFVALVASVAEKSVMAWYARMRGVPSLIFPRGGALIDQCSRSRVLNFLVKLGFLSSQKILCQGSRWQEFAIKKIGFAADSAPIITNWVATENLLNIGNCRSESPPFPTYLFLGWLEKEKGVFDLLIACDQLNKDGVEFKLILAGDGRAKEAAREFVRVHNLENNVDLRGWVPDSNLEAVFKEANIFVLPSWSEGLPNALIEAMAAKMAVITSPVGNIPDVIQDHSNGILVPIRNPNKLKSAMKLLSDDPELANRLACKAFLHAKEKYTVEPAVNAIVSAIRSTIEER